MSIDQASGLAFRGQLDAARALAKRSGPSPEARWVEAYVDAARGNFSRAERSLCRILSSDSAPADTRARAVLTLGSVLRQTGRHSEARDRERRALKDAPTRELRAHLLIGLAADAVGLGDLTTVDATLRRLGARPAGGWRVAVRLRWVRCERELLAGRPAPAAAHARRALAVAERARARRHRAKSLLFLGAALAEAAERDPSERRAAARAVEADSALRRARALALSTGARPIAAVAGRLLGRPSSRR